MQAASRRAYARGFVRLEHDRKRAGYKRGGAGRLDYARRDQHVQSRRKRAQRGREREHEQRKREHTPATEQIR